MPKNKKRSYIVFIDEQASYKYEVVAASAEDAEAAALDEYLEDGPGSASDMWVHDRSISTDFDGPARDNQKEEKK